MNEQLSQKAQEQLLEIERLMEQQGGAKIKAKIAYFDKFRVAIAHTGAFMGFVKDMDKYLEAWRKQGETELVAKLEKLREHTLHEGMPDLDERQYILEIAEQITQDWKPEIPQMINKLELYHQYMEEHWPKSPVTLAMTKMKKTGTWAHLMQLPAEIEFIRDWYQRLMHDKFYGGPDFNGGDGKLPNGQMLDQKTSQYDLFYKQRKEIADILERRYHDKRYAQIFIDQTRHEKTDRVKFARQLIETIGRRLSSKEVRMQAEREALSELQDILHKREEEIKKILAQEKREYDKVFAQQIKKLQKGTTLEELQKMEESILLKAKEADTLHTALEEQPQDDYMDQLMDVMEREAELIIAYRQMKQALATAPIEQKKAILENIRIAIAAFNKENKEYTEAKSKLTQKLQQATQMMSEEEKELGKVVDLNDKKLRKLKAA